VTRDIFNRERGDSRNLIEALTGWTGELTSNHA
jgi:hypothetical protein